MDCDMMDDGAGSGTHFVQEYDGAMRMYDQGQISCSNLNVTNLQTNTYRTCTIHSHLEQNGNWVHSYFTQV